MQQVQKKYVSNVFLNVTGKSVKSRCVDEKPNKRSVEERSIRKHGKEKSNRHNSSLAATITTVEKPERSRLEKIGKNSPRSISFAKEQQSTR